LSDNGFLGAQRLDLHPEKVSSPVEATLCTIKTKDIIDKPLLIFSETFYESIFANIFVAAVV